MQLSNNLKAFLDAIAKGEVGTTDVTGYLALMGDGRFFDTSNHPALMGWPGHKLSDNMCRAAGQKPGCVSTAAGRYQIIRPTWIALRARLALTDFAAAAQDACAIELIREQGALPSVEAGNMTSAIKRVRRVWASLPGANLGQPEVAVHDWLAAYEQAGGTITA